MIASLADIERIARDTVARFPAPFRAPASEVVIQVVDRPPDDVLTELDIGDPLALTGLYDGIPMTEKSVMDMPLGPDVVWLFRDPILAELQDRGNVSLDALVAHVTIHEFAHHFGWSDADIAPIDRWWE